MQELDPQTLASRFIYDVAFSFLAEDEPIAKQLNDILTLRLSTFFYADADRQKRIAARDGDKVYTRVFAEEARTVVVLYRPGWGERGFTGIEATAIRNRAFEEGFDFVTFIPQHRPANMPLWVPKPRVWVVTDRWGIDHAAAVIESRVQVAGGSPAVETAEDKAARMQRQQMAENERRGFLHSQAGFDAALAGFRAIVAHLKRVSEHSAGLLSAPQMQPSSAIRPVCEMASATTHWKIQVIWNPSWSNTTDKAELLVNEFHGTIFDYEHKNLPGPKRRTSLIFDTLHKNLHGWRLKSDRGGRLFTHADLADWAAQRLLDRVDEQRRRGEPT